MGVDWPKGAWGNLLWLVLWFGAELSADQREAAQQKKATTRPVSRILQGRGAQSGRADSPVDLEAQDGGQDQRPRTQRE